MIDKGAGERTEPKVSHTQRADKQTNCCQQSRRTFSTAANGVAAISGHLSKHPKAQLLQQHVDKLLKNVE